MTSVPSNSALPAPPCTPATSADEAASNEPAPFVKLWPLPDESRRKAPGSNRHRAITSAVAFGIACMVTTEANAAMKIRDKRKDPAEKLNKCLGEVFMQ